MTTRLIRLFGSTLGIATVGMVAALTFIHLIEASLSGMM